MEGVAFGAVVVLLSYFFRYPALLNADATNSDAAVVGLQAMHILRGEHMLHLWGSGYQTSVDSYVAAAFFKVLAATPLALMLSSLTMHVVLTLGVYFLGCRFMKPRFAFLAALPLILTASVVHSYALYPPRQTALTLGILAFVVLESETRKKAFLAALLGLLAAFADPYALLFLPVLAMHLVLVGQDAGRTLRTVVDAVFGALLGGIPLLVLRFHSKTVPQPTSLELSRVFKNFGLLLDPCLSWVLGLRNYVAKDMMDYAPWDGSPWQKALSISGTVSLLVLLVVSARAIRDPRISPRAARLGLVGVVLMAETLVAFLFSVMVMDHFSMRYLVGFILGIPFALMPILFVVSRTFVDRTFVWMRLGKSEPAVWPALVVAALILCFSISEGVSGWVGFGPFVDGVTPRRLASADNPELLLTALRREHVRDAIADYWAAYRLEFIYAEEPFVVPTNPEQDRNAAQRARVLAAKRYAFIVDRQRSYDAPIELLESQLEAEGTIEKRVDYGTLTAFIVRRL